MNKDDRKLAISMTNEGMIAAQELMERAKNRRELKMGEAMFNAFYALELLYKDCGIEPERRF